MRTAPLTTIQGGINRIRQKGGARADDLYDFENGYRLDGGKLRVRPGTRRKAKLDVATKGLVSFNGELHTFCHRAVYVPAGFVLNILVSRDETDSPIPLRAIHFAEPFMGALYVVAEFEDNGISHYWLQPGVAWEASKTFKAGDIVYPSTATGLVYRASRNGSAYPAWAANVLRADGTGADPQSIIEPTTYNDFYYKCIDTTGASPRSGTTEPAWPTEAGATVVESTDNPPDVNIPATTSPVQNTVPASVTDRYGAFVARTVTR